MSENSIFTATSNVAGHIDIRFSRINLPASVFHNVMVVQTLNHETGEWLSVALSRNETEALRDALTKSLLDSEIEAIVDLLS